MGRSSKSRKRQLTASSTQKKLKHRRPKRQKRERFWIEDCKDSSLSTKNAKQISLEVLITQSQLVDDYRQVPRSKNDCNVVTVGDTLQNIFNKKDNLKTSSSLNLEIKNDTDNVQEKSTDGKKKTKEQEVKKINIIENCNNTAIFNDTEDNNDGIKSKDIQDDFSDAFICIKRAKSAMKPMEITGHDVEGFRPLPNGDCGDGIFNPYDDDEVPDKFWSQRRRLFKRFDDGIQLDKESWYSVTPEAIANHISSHLVSNREGTIVLDPFVGCGGNAIAFARLEEVKLVVCVDKDRSKLLKAAHNAAIYGIPKEKMVFLHDNAFRILSYYKDKKMVKILECKGKMNKNKYTSKEFKFGGVELLPDSIDIVFLSPPWGGIDYAKVGKRNYDLKCIRIDGIEENIQMDGDDILNKAANALGQEGPIGLFLPKNINGVALGRSVLRAGYNCPMVLEKNVLNGKLKTVTAYIGL